MDKRDNRMKVRDTKTLKMYYNKIHRSYLSSNKEAHKRKPFLTITGSEKKVSLLFFLGAHVAVPIWTPSCLMDSVFQ